MELPMFGGVRTIGKLYDADTFDSDSTYQYIYCIQPVMYELMNH